MINAAASIRLKADADAVEDDQANRNPPYQI